MANEELLGGGRFVLLGPLGQGAQGQTFDAIDRREGVPVAIKKFDVRGARSWKDAELAEREARVLQTLSHSKLPAYIDHFEQDGVLYLVMEKIEGETVASLRRRGVPFREEDVLQFLTDASDALDYLHRRPNPVIHRDIKPGNVLRRPDGSFAFVDFGAVRDKLRPDGGSTVVGTFGYMAPEQFQGRALPGSDVYAVGATALAMLSGREPEDLPHAGLAVDVRRSLRGVASDRLVEVLERMLEPDPDRRASRIDALLPALKPRRGRGRVAASASSGDSARDWRESAADRFERAAEDYERRAAEYERKASAGGHGARGWLRGAKGFRRGAAKWRAAARKYRDAQLRRSARIEARAQRMGSRRVSPPILMLLLLGLAVGTVAILLATQLIVPLVLWLLSQFLAPRALTAASAAVRRAGRRAVGRMKAASEWLRASEGSSMRPGLSGESSKVRVDVPSSGTGVGAYDGSSDHEDEHEDATKERGRYSAF